jgi:hypothetical protein
VERTERRCNRWVACWRLPSISYVLMVLLFLLGLGSVIVLFRKHLLILFVGLWVFVAIIGLLNPS